MQRYQFYWVLEILFGEMLKVGSRSEEISEQMSLGDTVCSILLLKIDNID